MKYLKKHKLIFAIFFLTILALSCPITLTFCETSNSNEFNIPRVISSVDANNNGIDDYTDILLGAQIDAYNHPDYDDRYWNNDFILL